MAKKKSTETKNHLKLLTLLTRGDVITKQEIGQILGNELYMYRISAYIYQLKTECNAIIKVYKQGRTVISYQLINVDECKQYLRRVGSKFDLSNTSKMSLPQSKSKVVNKMNSLGAVEINNSTMESV